MQEENRSTNSEGLSLEDVVRILRARYRLILGFTLVAGIAATIYNLSAKTVYASTAMLSVAPAQVQAQLEQRIQVQRQEVLTYEGLEALAFSEGVLRKTWEALNREGALPPQWEAQGAIPGFERMARNFEVRNRSPRQQTAGQLQLVLPTVVASFTVRADSPSLAASTANLWVEEVAREVNRLPLVRAKANAEALDEQVRFSRKRYVEAQTRWEIFQKNTTLVQDQAELASKIEERVAAKKELSSIERDLAAVRGKIRSLQLQQRQQAALVPIGTPPDQLAIFNHEANRKQGAALLEETSRAFRRYAQAAQSLEEFRRREGLALWQAELNGYVQGYASSQARLITLSNELAVRRKQLEEAETRLGQYRNQLAQLSLDSLLAGMTLGEADQRVSELLRQADARLKAAEDAWEKYQRESQLDVMKQQLASFTSRIADVRKRLERILTDQSIVTTRLEAAEQELSKEAKILALEREITSDPAAAAVLVSQGNLGALLGLKLRNQELNPTHQKLLFAALDARAELAALEAERRALTQEEARLASQVLALQQRIADEEFRRARLSADLEVGREIYTATLRYTQNLKRLSNESEIRLREVNPDVLRFRDQVVDLEGQIATLEAEEDALKRSLMQYEQKIKNLRRQIALQEREKEALLIELNARKATYESLQARYEALASVADSGLSFDSPNPEYQRLRSAIIDALAEEAALTSREATLRAQLKELDAQIVSLRERIARANTEQELTKQSLEVARNVFLAISQKRTDLEIELASAQNSLAQIIAPAYPVYEPASPNRPLILMAAIVLGLFLGTISVFVAEALKSREAA